MNKSRCAAALAVLSVSLVAQSKIIVVDAQNRPGTDFKDLPVAVLAAKPGDRLAVRAGTYFGFTTDKGIAVLGEPGSRIVAAALFQTTVRVQNLPKGASFRLSGFQLLPRRFGDQMAFSGRNCKGAIHLERLTGARQASIAGPLRPTALFDSCKEVTLAQCKFTGQPAVLIRSGTLLAADTECVGVNGFAGHGEFAAGAGVRAEHSHAVLSRCVLVGGSLAGSGRGLFVRAQPGLDSVASTWTVTGAAGTSVRGGSAVPSAPAIGGKGSVTLDPIVRLVPGRGAPPVGSGITLQRQDVPSLRALGAPLKGTVRIDLRSRPGDFGFLFSGALAGRLPLGSFGDFWLDPRRTFFVAAGTHDRNGKLALAIPVPGNWGLFGLRIAWQGFAGTLSGGLRLSNPASYVHDK